MKLNKYINRTKDLKENIFVSFNVIKQLENCHCEITKWDIENFHLCTLVEKKNIIRLGISKQDLEEIMKATLLDYNKVAKLLSLSNATIFNKRGQKKFTLKVSEKIVGLADIYSFGYIVFEDKIRFNSWMFKPNIGLGGLHPYEFLNSKCGREVIQNIIGRINYGVYS